MANRLASETSPYLLQHRDNPVDWFPWGSEAFERARDRDVPILLSVGYAACHWCHVMEKESFEDPATAETMNENFVCIKVDREERPDLDSIYMTAVQSLTGHGGWPMTVFLTPKGEPFYGGTYFPPEDRHGMPAFTKVLDAISTAWREQRSEIESQGLRLVEHISATESLRASSDPIESTVLTDAVAALRASFDEEWGGFGRAPKFPQPMTLDLLLRAAKGGDDDALAMARRTLDAMAAGGMFDQLGGGFARYSVDRYWLVPHFEKMLYDNALLLRTYARAHLLTGEHRYRHVAEATAAWMLGEMRDPNGGFYSSLDADSEGEEGRFYVWTLDEIREVAGPDADAAVSHFGASEEGNFEERNILVYARRPEDADAVARARAALLARRAQRVRPATDDKILAAWNGLAAAALAEAGAALGHDDWVDAARSALEFVLANMRIDGRLMRSFRQGRANHLGCCDDYALILEACLAVYEATFEQHFLDEAMWAARSAVELFEDPENGGFYLVGNDAEPLVARPKEAFDNAVPSPNSVLALELQRLALLFTDTAWEEPALRAMRLTLDLARRAPHAFGHMLCAVDFYLGSPREIVIAGDPEEAAARAMLQVVRSTFLPNKVVVAGTGSTPPLLEDKEQLDGKATAFVCERGSCRLPVDDAQALRAQLTEL